MKKNVKVRNILFCAIIAEGKVTHIYEYFETDTTIRVRDYATIYELYLYEVFLDYFTIMVIITSFEEFDSAENLYRVPLRITQVISISP